MIISASLMPQQMLLCNIPIGLQTVLLMLPIILTTLKIVQSLRLVQIIIDYNHFTYTMYGRYFENHILLNVRVENGMKFVAKLEM